MYYINISVVILQRFTEIAPHFFLNLFKPTKEARMKKASPEV